MKWKSYLVLMGFALIVSSIGISCIFSSDEDDCKCTQTVYSYGSDGFPVTTESEINCTSELNAIKNTNGSASKIEYDDFGRTSRVISIDCN